MKDEKIKSELSELLEKDKELLGHLEKVLQRESNLFRVIDRTGGKEEDITNRERLYSDFLAWLLDSKGSHGLGADFLNSFLEKLEAKSSEFREQNNKKFFEGWRELDLTKADVTRESPTTGGRRTDVWIEFDDRVCVIENKIESGEKKGKLEDYGDEAERKSYGNKFLCLLLAPKKRNCSKYNYFYPISYETIFEVLKEDINNQDLDKNTRILIEQYKRAIMKKIGKMSDGIEEILNQVEEEYPKVKEVIKEGIEGTSKYPQEKINRLLCTIIKVQDWFDNDRWNAELRGSTNVIRIHGDKNNWWRRDLEKIGRIHFHVEYDKGQVDVQLRHQTHNLKTITSDSPEYSAYKELESIVSNHPKLEEGEWEFPENNKRVHVRKAIPFSSNYFQSPDDNSPDNIKKILDSLRALIENLGDIIDTTITKINDSSENKID